MDLEILDKFREFLNETKRVCARTQYRYLMAVRDLDLENLTQESLNAHIQKKKNDSVVRGAALSLLEFLGIQKDFDMPPKATGRQHKRIIRSIAKEEIKRVRVHLYEKSFKKGLMFDLTYQGALRRFELPTIRLNSFKWDLWLQDPVKPCQLIIKGKGNKERIVLINPETAEALLNFYLKHYKIETDQQLSAIINNPSFIFRNKKGEQLSEHMLWKIIRNGSIEAIGRNIRPHELRHERSTELERLGVPIKDIKNYLGHSSLATTEIYLHTSEQESIENIQNIINKTQ